MLHRIALRGTKSIEERAAESPLPLPSVEITARESQSPQVEMRPGDTLLVYTDGYSEAMNRRFDEFDRLHVTARVAAQLRRVGLGRGRFGR